MANAAPPDGPQGAVSDSVSSFPEWSPLMYPDSVLAPVAVAVETEPAAPLISLSDVTPSTADILLITLNSASHQHSDESITQLDTSQNLVITSIANEDTALLLSPTDGVSLSSTDDLFLAPAPKATLTKHTELRNARHPQKTYAKPPPTTQLKLRPDDIHVPVSQIVPVTQVKLNDNSLLKALISRPCMKIPPANIMRSIQIPIIRPVAQQSTVRTPTRKPAKTTARTTPVRASTRVVNSPGRTSDGGHKEVPISIATLNTETKTSFAVTSAMSLLSDSAAINPYLTTASLITIPLTTLSYATTKTYAPCAQKSRVSTPTLMPLTTSTVTSVATSKSPVKATSIAGVGVSTLRSLTTATVTALTTTITNTNVKLISTDNYISTVTRDIDSHTRATYAMKARNPSSIAVQSLPAITVVTGTTSTATAPTLTTAATLSTEISISDTQFLEPLPVTKSRTAPAARTFSGPRKATVNQCPTGNVSQRVIIRHANPRAFEKLLKNPAPLHKIADAAVTRLNDVSEIINIEADDSGLLSTSSPTISFTTTSTGTHTLIVPHYKDTVFKNLSSIAYADPASLGSPRCPTERIVIRRPVAYFSPRRSFSCLTPVRAQNSSTEHTAQRTIIRAVPVSLADNPQHVLRTDFINLPQSVLTTATVPDNILAETTSLLTLATQNNINTTKS